MGTAQPRKTPTLDYLPPIQQGLKYGATHPLRRVLSLPKTSTQSMRDKTYGEIWSVQPPRPQSPSSKYQRAIRRHKSDTVPSPASAGPSLSENPPKEDMSNCPSPECPALNTMINFISYHTPAAAGVGNRCVLSSVLSIHKPHDKNTQDETCSHL
ncbi:hypothetical protein BS47DRAFT_1369520 [Hydnum rufescens UP504]|uniref:Uncharacterized protein n=1 Tax=Hydnum rufescens UP504 TaxID=1448309 RepID=A0A9P6ACL9_9AGAM|nr:hypothetical protein BS47DRAFT_1369520 [Hydnum rufescens UP504]